MKGEDFLKELNDLETGIIKEAREPIIRKKKKMNGNIIKFVALASCITVFTGAVILRSINVQPNKNIYPAEKNTSEEKELQTQEKSTELSDIEITEKKQIIWLNYDVTQDGIKDKITIDIPAEHESRMAGCTITDGNNEKVIYHAVFSPAYPSWGELYLCEREGLVYFIEYNPVLYQGTGNYHYEVFVLTGGEKTILNENDMFFNLSEMENYTEYIDKMGAFYYEINDYLSDSMLLISTVNGEIQYSEEHNRLFKQEEYEFLYENNLQYIQENMYEKLREYFLYLSEQIQYAKNHISLIVLENTLTPSGASFQIINTSGTDGYSEEVYYIEEFGNKQWEICDYVSDDIAFQDTKWPITDGESYSFAVDWSNVYGKLDNGSYRLVKKISLSENICIEAVCNFEISKETNQQNIVSKDNYGKE